jgi:hypothetical protein
MNKKLIVEFIEMNRKELKEKDIFVQEWETV